MRNGSLDRFSLEVRLSTMRTAVVVSTTTPASHSSFGFRLLAMRRPRESWCIT